MENSASCALSNLSLADLSYVSDHQHKPIHTAACSLYLQITNGVSLLQLWVSYLPVVHSVYHYFLSVRAV